jgi:hypothetical protein
MPDPIGSGPPPAPPPPPPGAVDAQGYTAILDATIDKMLEKQGGSHA